MLSDLIIDHLSEFENRNLIAEIVEPYVVKVRKADQMKQKAKQLGASVEDLTNDKEI